MKVKWKNNQIDENDLKPYLKKFGDKFFIEIKRLVDEAMIEENNQEKVIYEAHETILYKNLSGSFAKLNDKSQIAAFKELITEILAHANEYNAINSKFFGRDSLMVKVIKIFCKA